MFARNLLARKLVLGAAVGTALAMAGLARAGVAGSDLPVVPQTYNLAYLDDATTMPASAPVATAPAAAPVTTLNGALNHIPGYSDSGFSVTGYVEGSWTYSAHPPAGNILYDRSFDTKTESIQFDALDILVTRSAFDATKPFDFNINLEQLYGWDSAYIHSNGLALVSNGKTPSNVGLGAGSTATIHPKAQYDLNQANVILSFGKVGNGLTITGGKFLTLVGYEVINTVANATNTVSSSTPSTGGGLYSHSYIFDEEPYTHTGLLATYNLTDPSGPAPMTVTGGFSRGWDQATEDSNGDVDIMGQYRLAVPNKYIVQFTGITGNEQPSGTQDGWRTVLDFVGAYQYSDQLTLGVNGMFAWQAQDKNVTVPGGVGGTGIWYGAAAYARYTQSEYLTFNARAEWFDDQNGGAPTQLADPASPNVGTANQFYEVTLGLAYTPLPNTNVLKGLTIRPEGRWDYSDHAAFNGGAQHDQWTASIEAYFSF
jgi:hypothetical protein